MERGKVWLVGAGPGDGGLLTLKGQEVLSRAEVVVYDSLVGQEVLTMIPEGAQKINAGKRCGSHHLSQEEISQLLVSEAEKGKRVVRLKGGDPFLFGRGGEELEVLTEQGIPFEVVPGVPSALAVPAYFGIPITHRDYASSVHIITGHPGTGKKWDIDFSALVKAGGTLVFLMGTSSLGEICRGLLCAGMDPQMPAALLSQGTTSGQRKVLAPLSSLEEEAREAGLPTPALIVVGRVCALSDRFSWRESLPLFGWKILLTRPRERSPLLARELYRLGAEVLEIPSIRTVPLPDPDLPGVLLEEVRRCGWLVFTSPFGVEVFCRLLMESGADLRCLCGKEIAAIGEGTAGKLKEQGIIADLIPPVYDGESLGLALASRIKEGEKILIPRAEKGNQNLVPILERSGALVRDLPIYRTEYESSSLIDLQEEFDKGTISCTVFTSASTVEGFVHALPGVDYTQVRAACLGEHTASAARSYGMEVQVAGEARVESLLSLILEMKQEEE